MAKTRPDRFHESEPRPETPPEFSRRVRDMMDQDSWQGTDRVGVDFPEPAEIVEYPADETTRIYRRKEGV
jgi:hypothetical protein